MRNAIKEPAYMDPAIVIEQDEVLRSISHSIAHRVLLGWLLIQGLVGSGLVMFVDELYTVGLSLFGFAFLTGSVWQVWLSRKGLVSAAREATLSRPGARRMAWRVALFQGLFFGTVMGVISAFWLNPQDGAGLHILFGVLCGVFFGFAMWFQNGRLTRSNDEA